MSFTYKETEEKIKKYYESLRVIGGLKHRLEIYKRRKADIERKIENSVIKLADNFGAVSYDGVGGGSGVKISPQEKAVDKAFSLLEKNLEEVKVEMFFIEEQMKNIEMDNSDMEYILKEIKPEYKEIIDYIYKNKSGTLKASVNLHLGRATIYRKKDEVIKDIMKWLNYYSRKT